MLFRALLVRAVRLAAMPVQNQRVIANFEPQPLRHRMLTFFDAAIHELFDTAAVNTHDVIVVGALVQFEHRHAALEMMARDEAGRFELGQDTVDGGESDVLVGYQELLVDVLRAHVARRTVGQNIENFQSGAALLSGPHCAGRCFRWWSRISGACGMLCPQVSWVDYQSFNGCTPL